MSIAGKVVKELLSQRPRAPLAPTLKRMGAAQDRDATGKALVLYDGGTQYRFPDGSTLRIGKDGKLVGSP
jgi:hypothetical protein